MGQIMNCPKCKKEIKGYPAISRKDNKTKICSDCGIREALEPLLPPEEIERIVVIVNGLASVYNAIS